MRSVLHMNKKLSHLTLFKLLTGLDYTKFATIFVKFGNSEFELPIANVDKKLNYRKEMVRLLHNIEIRVLGIH